MKELHQPVLTKEVLTYLNLQKNGFYLDCTLGSGGHSQVLLQKQPKIKIIAFDQDQEAIARCQQNPFFASQPITFLNDNFVNFPHHLANLNITKVDGFLFDLGVSSEQLATPERGFSYRQNALLDMRMNQQNKLTAAEIINNYRYQELVTIFSYYGEEPKAKKIARRICQVREKSKITTTQQLVQVIAHCQTKKSQKHPARRVFQALRIAVNQELTNLTQILPVTLSYLNKNGRIIVISYHSLEDRIVKQVFRKYDKLGFQILTKKPVIPSSSELAENRQARSAKMRVITRIN